ncbi:MAG: hypothetical protein SOW77_02625 [Ruminococcus sp.]|nr:hypothetical protein [Ruminococcus sp.]
MTAATSTLKKSFFKTHFKNTILENKKFLFIVSVLHLIGYPVIAFTIRYYSEHPDNTDESYAIASCIALAIAILSGAIIAISIFNYLYKKSTVDMNLSLPLTTRQRFLSEYFAGLTIYIVPAIIGGLIGTVILLTGKHELMEFLKYTIYIGSVVIIGMILYYSLTVLILSCCGSLFETILSTLLINAMIPASIYLLSYTIISNDSFGLSSNSLFLNQIFISSPIGNAAFIIYFFDNVNMYGNVNTNLYVHWLIPTLIFTVLIVLLSYFLYKKRKAEQVSKPYVYKFIYYAILFFVTFCIISIFKVSTGSSDYTAQTDSTPIDASFFPAVMCSGIVFFIMEIISNRGFKKFWLSILKFAGTITCIYAVLLLCHATNEFGVNKYVPLESAVDNVIIDFDNTSTYNLPIRNKHTIHDVVSLHEKVIKEKYEDKNTSHKEIPESELDQRIKNGALATYNRNNISITYYLKNGSILTREYNVSDEQMEQLYASMMTGRDYAEYCYNKLSYSFAFRVENDKNARNIEIYNKINQKISTTKLTVDEFSKLIKAYKNDIENMSADSFYTDKIIGTIDLEYPIRESFINTLNFLEEYCNISIDDFEVTSLGDNNAVAIFKDVVQIVTGNYDEYCYDDYYNSYAQSSKPSYTILSKYISLYNNSLTSVAEYSRDSIVNEIANKKEFIDLLNNASVYYDNDEIGGIIVVNNQILYLSPEYKERVEKLYNQQPELLYWDNMNVFVDENDNLKYYDDENRAHFIYADKQIGIYYDGNEHYHYENNKKVYFKSMNKER